MNVKIFMIILLAINIMLANSGSEAGAFLRHQFGAVESGRGGISVAWDEISGYSFFYNPSLLPQTSERFATMAFQFLPLDRQIYSAGINLPLPPTGALSFNIIHVGVRNLFAYNSLGENLGEIDFGDDIFYASFAQKINRRLYVGINLKYIIESYKGNDVDFEYNAKGRGLDLGVYSPVNDKIGVGFVMSNIAGQIRSNTGDLFERGLEIVDKFPVTFSLGGRYNIRKNIKFGADYKWNSKGKKDLLTGIEGNFNGISIRTGLFDGHFNAGMGFVKKISRKFSLRIDYGFVSGLENEGASHLFNWNFVF
ncbi:MAG: hypothetical protein Kow00108_27320 [Calditrichia bacterium]